MTSVYLAKSVLSMEINDIVERHGTQRRLRRVTCTCIIILYHLNRFC